MDIGIFPNQYNITSTVMPFLRTYNLNKDDPSNDRSTTHLSFLSKQTKPLAKSRLTDFLSNNRLLNNFQPAHTKSN